MRDYVWALCVVSVLSGVLLDLTPEGSVKRVMKLVSGLVLLGLSLRCLGGVELDTDGLDLTRYQRIEQQLLVDGGRVYEELDRRVIEEEYSAYVQQRADAMGIAVEDVRIRVRWHTEGGWVPASSSVILYSAQDQERLAGVLAGELGIPEERQEWGRTDGSQSVAQAP